MHLAPPKKILVESLVVESPLVSSLRRSLPQAQFKVVEHIGDTREHDPEALEVVAFRGRFLKSCPGTRHYHCCGYRILHFGIQCSLDCTYCILQAYLNLPNLRLFGNIHESLQELREELQDNKNRLYRIGTGEFTDSLLLDPWTGLSGLLVPFFAEQSNAVLELKTKTNFVDGLAELDHRGRTIVGWSLNSEHVRRHEEPRAAGLSERLEAARRCARWGYSLAFHFDPLIEHPEWQKGYADILDRLFDAVDPAGIVYISLGAFRFMPDLKPVIRSRHPRSRILYGEFIRSPDEKMRYFRDIRVEMYEFVADRIRRADPRLCTYLCMESGDVWRDVFGFSPDEKGGLPAILDEAVRERMGVSTRFAAEKVRNPHERENQSCLY